MLLFIIIFTALGYSLDMEFNLFIFWYAIGSLFIQSIIEAVILTPLLEKVEINEEVFEAEATLISGIGTSGREFLRSYPKQYYSVSWVKNGKKIVDDFSAKSVKIGDRTEVLENIVTTTYPIPKTITFTSYFNDIKKNYILTISDSVK